MKAKHTLHEASKILGISYRAVRYYLSTYSNDVVKEGRSVYVSDAFIKKVAKNRVINEKRIQEPRTKQELLNEIADLENQLQEAKNIISEYENSEIYEKADEGLRVEVFSEQEYNLFVNRLNEWKVQAKEIEYKNKELTTLEDTNLFVIKQLEYFKNANDKILQQHQLLIEAIGQRNRIEAVEKEVIPKRPYDVE